MFNNDYPAGKALTEKEVAFIAGRSAALAREARLRHEKFIADLFCMAEHDGGDVVRHDDSKDWGSL